MFLCPLFRKMRYLKIPFWIVYKIYVGMVFYGTLILLYPIFKYYLAKEETWPMVFLWEKRWGRLIQFLAFFKLRVTGQEHFPEPPYIIVSNHQSYIDTVLMYGIVPDYFVFLGKGELRNWPFFRIFFRSGMNISVDRNNASGASKAFKQAINKLQKGESVAIFAEGGIMYQAPELSRFKNGAFKLALAMDVPIVPVAIFNSYKVMGSTFFFTTSARPGVARAKVMPPIYCEGYTDKDLVTLRENTRSIIKAELDRYEGRQ